MSGHNRWTKIKRYKAVVGAAKGRLFSKVIKEITVSARLGGGDPAGNARLRVALAAAKAANIPADTVTRAVKKGTGELEGVQYEEVLYEGYGPGGVAMLVECLTDNTNRTASDVRSAFSSHGGSLAAQNAVKFVFQHRGNVVVKAGPAEDVVMAAAIDAGADDVLNHGADGFEVRTEPGALHQVAAALEKAGLSLGEQKWIWTPTTSVPVEGEKAKLLLKLMEVLEENDDVQNVSANFEMDEKLMEQWV
ncbi:MAG: YebC/PmpR family DNA-binding transcriptional regulator [Myxococcaceae bacterium]|nr:YebC/PmpR family DNA-binding transcriptional regulator [Myxococcaceae bacterium]